MKFTASSGALLKQLQIISAVISSKVVIPILEYLLFEIEKDKLKIVGTDLEVSIQGTMAVESDDVGKIAVPARLMIDILRTLPEQPITFNINNQNIEQNLGKTHPPHAGKTGGERPNRSLV